MLSKIMLVLALSCLLCQGQDVGILAGKERTGSAEQRQFNSASDRIADILRYLAIPFRRLEDDRLAPGQLDAMKVLFLPQNHILPAESSAVLDAFVKAGGSLAVFYNSDPQVLRLLGIEKTRYVSRGELGELSGIKFEHDVWQAAPEFLRQRSGNLLEPVLPEQTTDVKVVGKFHRPDGSDSGYVGVTLHDNGFYMSHIYLGQDRQGGAQFFLSFIGSKVPEHWKNAAEEKIAACARIFDFSEQSELQSWCEPFGDDGKESFAEAEQLLQQARQALNERRYEQAYSSADQALKLSREFFLTYCPPRNGEMRGAWIHSPYGIADWGWDKTVEVLAKNGFNAIFPNFLWGYVADYPSEVLPNHPSVSGQQGKIDYLQQCLEACRKYQVELHVWKVNWNMGHRTPEDLRQKMRIMGRTQITLDGRDSDYLSPHHPDNFALERDSMLEIVRKYPVDGIHFDYIRYPNNSTDFGFDARIAFEQHLGHPVQNWPDDCLPRGVDYQAYTQWRRDNISKLVREVSLEARKIRPGIKVSAAIYGDWESARLAVAQDAGAWIDEGLLDFICPMNYTASTGDFVHLLQKQLLRVGNRIPVYPGIGVYLLPDATAVAEQIMLSRKHGADGFLCFQHNAEFAETILPGLRRGLSSLTVTEPLPHHGQPLEIKLNGSQAGLPAGFYSLSEALLAELQLPTNVNPSAFRLNLLRNGWDTAPEAKFNLRREQQTLFCRLDIGQPGHYRLELHGENELGLPLLSRGESFQVLSADDEKELLRREGVPEFAENGGLKVAVWQYQSYGGEAILAFLRQQSGLDAVALYNLHPATLHDCQVIVIPQPKNKAEEFKKSETGSLLNNFIRQGGGLLLTHAMVGNRGFVNPVPELIESVPEAPLNSAFWKVSDGHPTVAGLAEVQHESAYPFIVSMRPSVSAVVLAHADEQSAVIVAGELDKGRYVGCGLGLGLGRGEVAAPLSATERQLLLNIINWLGQKKELATSPREEQGEAVP